MHGSNVVLPGYHSSTTVVPRYTMVLPWYYLSTMGIPWYTMALIPEHTTRIPWYAVVKVYCTMANTMVQYGYHDSTMVKPQCHMPSHGTQ